MAEYFRKVVTPKAEVTFREQSKVWLKQLQSRKRNPIRESYAVTIQGGLDKWILPAIGDVPLGSVDNLTVKPLIETMCSAKLSPRTVNKYVEHVKPVVASMKCANGEPVHKRTWDAETMDLFARGRIFGAEASVSQGKHGFRTHQGEHRARTGVVCLAGSDWYENL